MIRVGGLAPFSTNDFPGRLAAVVFVQGCPWRCRYCHNPHLQARAPQPGATSWQEALDFLERRRGLLEAVVFSGGEPTVDPGLGAAIDDVRRLGFDVGLHTAGVHPRRLALVLPLVDWVGFDLKGLYEDYAGITARTTSARAAFASLELLIESKVGHEVRTTWHPELMAAGKLLELVTWLRGRGAARFALQEFRARGCADPGLAPCAVGPELLRDIEKRWPGFTLRRSQ